MLQPDLHISREKNHRRRQNCVLLDGLVLFGLHLPDSFFTHLAQLDECISTALMVC